MVNPSILQLQVVFSLTWYSMYSVLHNSQEDNSECDRLNAIAVTVGAQVTGWYLTTQSGNKLFQYVALVYLLWSNFIIFSHPGRMYADFAAERGKILTQNEILRNSASEWYNAGILLFTDPLTFN